MLHKKIDTQGWKLVIVVKSPRVRKVTKGAFDQEFPKECDLAGICGPQIVSGFVRLRWVNLRRDSTWHLLTYPKVTQTHPFLQRRDPREDALFFVVIHHGTFLNPLSFVLNRDQLHERFNGRVLKKNVDLFPAYSGVLNAHTYRELKP